CSATAGTGSPPCGTGAGTLSDAVLGNTEHSIHHTRPSQARSTGNRGPRSPVEPDSTRQSAGAFCTSNHGVRSRDRHADTGGAAPPLPADVPVRGSLLDPREIGRA